MPKTIRLVGRGFSSLKIILGLAIKAELLTCQWLNNEDEKRKLVNEHNRHKRNNISLLSNIIWTKDFINAWVFKYLNASILTSLEDNESSELGLNQI